MNSMIASGDAFHFEIKCQEHRFKSDELKIELNGKTVLKTPYTYRYNFTQFVKHMTDEECNSLYKAAYHKLLSIKKLQHTAPLNDLINEVKNRVCPKVKIDLFHACAKKIQAMSSRSIQDKNKQEAYINAAQRIFADFMEQDTKTAFNLLEMAYHCGASAIDRYDELSRQKYGIYYAQIKTLLAGAQDKSSILSRLPKELIAIISRGLFQPQHLSAK